MVTVFSAGDSLLKEGFLEEAVPLLCEEISQRPGRYYQMYRLAWAYNRLGYPDSALSPAVEAWQSSPQNRWYMGEVLKALCALEQYDDVLEYSPFIHGGGVCRYYLAKAEMNLKSPGMPSRAYLESSLLSEDDSTAADAANWLSILLWRELPADSVRSLVSFAVAMVPDEHFYRCRYAELLAGAGEITAAKEQLLELRRCRVSTQTYWSAFAAVAKAEGDSPRELWALRRAWQARRTPAAASDLGWALYIAGRNSLREGGLVLASERLTEAASLGDSTDPFVHKADSLLELINEFTLENSAGYR